MEVVHMLQDGDDGVLEMAPTYYAGGRDLRFLHELAERKPKRLPVRLGGRIVERIVWEDSIGTLFLPDSELDR